MPEQAPPAPASATPAPEVHPDGRKVPRSKPGLVTWTILAGKFDVSVPTIHAWRKRKDAPVDPHWPTWKAYAKKYALASSKKGVTDDLRSQKVAAEVEFIKARTARARRETMLIAEVNAMHLELSTQVRAELYHQLESALPPKLEGQSVAQIRAILREAADAIVGRLAEGLKRFEEDR